MSLSKQFKTDRSLESEGVRITFGTNEDGTEIALVVARAGGANTRFQAVADVVLKPYRRQIANETVDNKVLRERMMEIYAKTVVKSWENVLLADVTGNEEDTGFAKFSVDNCLALFKRLPDFYADVQQFADQMTAFRAEELEADAKN